MNAAEIAYKRLELIGAPLFYNKRFAYLAFKKEKGVSMENDIVNHPSHYTDGKIEVIEFIEDKQLNFHRGNAIKYIARAGKKNKEKEIEDLQKAVWYLNREIERLKKEQK